MIDRCSICALPHNFPTLKFKNGKCELCEKFERKWKPWLNNPSLQKETEIKLQKKLKPNKKRLYDCIVGISGGKDSLYTLYLAVRKFKLKPLAVCIDNGFLTDEAKNIITYACKKLDVDLVSFKPAKIYELYKHFFIKTGTFCTVCFYVIIRGLQRFASMYSVPYILLGKSSRLDPVSPYGANPFFFKNVCRDAPSHLEPILKFTQGEYKDMFLDYIYGRLIKIPDYVRWDYEEIKLILKKELDIDMFTEHEDCWAFPIKQYLMVQKYGFGQRFLKATALVRNGLLHREEAIAIHKAELESKDKLPKVTEKFINTLNISLELFKKAPHISSKEYYKGLGNFLLLIRHKLIRGIK